MNFVVYYTSVELLRNTLMSVIFVIFKYLILFSLLNILYCFLSTFRYDFQRMFVSNDVNYTNYYYLEIVTVF